MMLIGKPLLLEGRDSLPHIRALQINAVSGVDMDEAEPVEQEVEAIPPVVDEHDESIAEELTLEQRLERLKKRRWNVFMMLGLAVIMFTFALLPMPSPAPWEDNDALTDSVSPGSLNKQLAYIWGFPIQGEDFTDVTTVIDIELTDPPHQATHLDVYIMEGHCDDLAFRGADYLKARGGDNADWTQHHKRIEADPGTYEVEFAIDPGSYCLTMEYVDSTNGTVLADSPSIKANAYFYSNSVIAGGLGLFCLLMSAFAFIGAQKDGKLVKSMQEPDSEMTPEQKVLSETSMARISAGPAGPPGAPNAEGPSGPPPSAAGPSGPPPSVEESETIEDIFHPAEDGYFFKVLPDGTYDQTPWFQDESGNYHPYTGPAE